MNKIRSAEDIQQDWDSNPRWKNVKRDYSADDVAKLSGSVNIEYSLAKQGAEKLWSDAQKKSTEAYEKMIEMGMAKEQARSILPLTVYTQVWWTASFQSIMNFIELRDEATAQIEIQEYARVLKKIMLNVFPETTKLWQEVYWDAQEK